MKLSGRDGRGRTALCSITKPMQHLVNLRKAIREAEGNMPEWGKPVQNLGFPRAWHALLMGRTHPSLANTPYDILFELWPSPVI